MKKKIKITDIDIKINTQKFPKDRTTWISLGAHIYVAWRTGRTYWFLDREHKEIKNKRYDDDKQIISWTYKGPWESFATNQESIKTKNFKIIFHKTKDYNKVKEAIFQ